MSDYYQSLAYRYPELMKLAADTLPVTAEAASSLMKQPSFKALNASRDLLRSHPSSSTAELGGLLNKGNLGGVSRSPSDNGFQSSPGDLMYPNASPSPSDKGFRSSLSDLTPQLSQPPKSVATPAGSQFMPPQPMRGFTQPPKAAPVLGKPSLAKPSNNVQWTVNGAKRQRGPGV